METQHTRYNTTRNYTHSPNIICCNCGGVGHVYARCNHPVTSYGVVCYTMRYDKATNKYHPYYLMVQRKDSLSFVEFMRGKYDLQNLEYMLRLFSHMTPEEREKIQTLDFDELWQHLWSQSHGRNFMKEYQRSKIKFTILKQGYYLKRQDCSVVTQMLDTSCEIMTFVNIPFLLQHSNIKLKEPEWGFPKGRRNFSSEDDRHCALREFREETGIDMSKVRCRRDLKPMEEVFTGSNKVRYKHVYYLAHVPPALLYEENLYNPKNKCQTREIRNVRWFDYEEAQSKIFVENIERKELLKRVHGLVTRQFTYNTSHI